jgi:hypothetical protein
VSRFFVQNNNEYPCLGKSGLSPFQASLLQKLQRIGGYLKPGVGAHSEFIRAEAGQLGIHG